MKEFIVYTGIFGSAEAFDVVKANYFEIANTGDLLLYRRNHGEGEAVLVAAFKQTGWKKIISKES